MLGKNLPGRRMSTRVRRTYSSLAAVSDPAGSGLSEISHRSSPVFKESVALRWLSASPHRGFLLMLEKNQEHESVCNEQQRNDEGWNEEGRSQLPRRKPGGISLVESVHEIEGSPRH